jgi:CRP/FNR family cyclic AMP-dependent transcriptional regulator
MPAEAELLKEVPLFQLLDDEERTALAEKLEWVRFEAGQHVFHTGDPGDSLFVISSGKVEVYFKNDTGERIVLEVATHGDFFGELSLLDSGGRSASVVAIEDTQALRLERDDLDSFVKKHPQAAMDLLAAMARRLRTSAEYLRHTATRNVNEATEDHRTRVQKAADWIAEFAGSIPFLLMHVVWFGLWLGINVIPGIPHFDPFPFGFLTLTVSLEAIFLSVFVLLSQNRQAAKDRVRSDIEYDVNLKAEMEIAHLHEKMDALKLEVLQRLERLQRGAQSEAERSRLTSAGAK